MAFRDPFAIAVLDGLAEVLDTVPTGMLLVGQPTDDPASLVPQLAGLAVDAVVFSLCGPGENPAVDHFAARGIPMFSTGVPDDPRVTQVRIDERAAFAQISGHVRDLGHTRVATVTMPLSTTGGRRSVAPGDPDDPLGQRPLDRAPPRLPRRLRPRRPGGPDGGRLLGRGRPRVPAGCSSTSTRPRAPRPSSPSPTSSPPA